MTQSSMRFAIVVLLAFAGPAHAEVPRPVATALPLRQGASRDPPIAQRAHDDFDPDILRACQPF